MSEPSPAATDTEALLRDDIAATVDALRIARSERDAARGVAAALEAQLANVHALATSWAEYASGEDWPDDADRNADKVIAAAGKYVLAALDTTKEPRND